jgi:hypothetical protein
MYMYIRTQIFSLPLSPPPSVTLSLSLVTGCYETQTKIIQTLQVSVLCER